MLALFPFLLFLTTLAAYLPFEASIERLVPQIKKLAPADVWAFMEAPLRSITSEQRPRTLVLSLLVSIWSASRGVDAIRRALNIAYDVKESRPFWATQLLSIAVTIAGAALLLLGLVLLVAGGSAGLWLAEKAGFETAYFFAIRQLRWPVTACLIAAMMALGYYVLPDVHQRIKFVTPGSIVATAVWLVATWGFGQYVAAFGSYNVTYGSLGGAAIMLVWLYLSGFTFVLGGTINAILHHGSPADRLRAPIHTGRYGRRFASATPADPR